ncbi:MAG: ATP-dependent DNA helicase RecG [Eubacteriales bacterium]
MKKDDSRFELSLENIKGIGPVKSARLNNMGIHNIQDLLFHFPRDYEDLRNIREINTLINGEIAIVNVRILAISDIPYKKGNKLLKWKVADNSSEMDVVFFNSGFSLSNFKLGEQCYLVGKYVYENNKNKMLHPKVIDLRKLSDDRILPVYPSTYGLNQNEFRKWIKQALGFIPKLKDPIPKEILAKNRLCSLEYGLMNMHFPKDDIKIKEAKYRFIFEEFLYLQLGLVMIKNLNRQKESGIAFQEKVDLEELCNYLPFELTKAQTRVIDEIFNDMESQKSMNRLMQGDVGSGKTVVAAFAIFKAAANGYQTVMMAPTQLLAMQHYNTMNAFFAKNNVRIGLLTSNTKAGERRELLDLSEKGGIDLLIGTHSVIQNEVKFSNLGLVITDEQHRFGVNQRFLLSEKGFSPDKIVMTATPIPRTLAMIIYGDLDISVIDQLPSSRKQIITKAFKQGKRQEAYNLLNIELKKGRQAFIVSPLIEENDFENPIKSAQSLYKELREFDSQLKEYRIGLLHGKLKDDQKNKIMIEFKEGKIDVLISTVIIEVGIDIPNASVMLIENAERFGLSQLHQLRGRVGRGADQAYCFLVSDCNGNIAKERIQTMVDTSDGFIISEKDLKLRGPGDLFGTRQHGLPELKIADLVKHMKIYLIARTAAEEILQEDENLTMEKNNQLKNAVATMFQSTFIDTL